MLLVYRFLRGWLWGLQHGLPKHELYGQPRARWNASSSWPDAGWHDDGWQTAGSPRQSLHQQDGTLGAHAWHAFPCHWTRCLWCEFTLVYRHMWVQLFWHSFEAVCIDQFYMIMHPCFIMGHVVFVVHSKLTFFFFSLLDFSSLHLCSQFGWNLSMEEMAVEQERPMWTLPPTRKPWRPWRNTELTCVRLQFLQQPSYYTSLFHLHKDGERKNGYSEDSVFLLANPLWWRVVVGKTVWKQWDYMQRRVLVWLLMTIKSRILIFSTLNNDKHDLRFCFWTNQILGVKQKCIWYFLTSDLIRCKCCLRGTDIVMDRRLSMTCACICNFALTWSLPCNSLIPKQSVYYYMPSIQFCCSASFCGC